VICNRQNKFDRSKAKFESVVSENGEEQLLLVTRRTVSRWRDLYHPRIAQSRIVYLCLPFSLARRRGRETRVYFTGYVAARFDFTFARRQCKLRYTTIRLKGRQPHSAACVPPCDTCNCKFQLKKWRSDKAF
jgi:hypothetical protein